MPGTTRYSATFDRTYEEEAKPSSPPNARRSRSQSWQANSGHDGRIYTPFASRSPAPRSSSTDNSPNKGTEFIPTRTAKTSVKAHNNPFQFVKVGTCPLYKKAEEQLKKAKEIKKTDVLKEEEEEWQSNLDSWKSRRRKMSEDVFRRQEELKLLELEEQIAQVSNKKTKTFSEMVESRATRGRALSLCLLTSPLEFQNWEFENKTHKNGSCSYTDESGENSTVNSEDEGVSVRGRHGETSINDNEMNHRTNGDAHTEQNGSKLDTQNSNKLNDVSNKPKENYIDSGLESISSSHRAGDTPDSGSDFSQDSNSSIDCDSPRTGVNVLEEFSSKSAQISKGQEISINLNLDEKGQDFGFTFLGGKNEGQVIIASILEGSKAESSDIHLGDRIITVDECDVSSKKHIEIVALIQKGREKGHINLLLWRHNKSTNNTNGLSVEDKHDRRITAENLNNKSYEKSIESENEMYVDDFEELKKQSEILANKKSDTANGNVQALTNGNKSPNKDGLSLKLSTESSTAPILKINLSNSAVEEPDKNGEKTELNSENQKKNIIKVKRVRRKGVYALNVDSNHVSQDGNSTNSLFPLSPVTELPSPADENKTVSSSLSSNNTLSVSNSQNGITKEGKQKSDVNPDIPVVQENSSVPSTPAKSGNFQSIALHNDLKHAEHKTGLNTENKTEAENTLSLTSKNKDSQDEKSKSHSIAKKVKTNKPKKVTTSENTCAVSENTKELPCASQFADVTSKTAIKDKSSSESKSSNTLENKHSVIKNDVENLTVPQTMENGIVSPEKISIKPATEVASVPVKTPASSNSLFNNTSSKVVTNSVESPITNKQSKISTSDDNKSTKNIQKKFIAKPKANSSEKKNSVSSTDVMLNEIYSTKEQNSSSVIEKQEKLNSKSETTVSLQKEENNVPLNGITNISQEIKPSPGKDEAPVPCPSTNKVRDLALKFGVKSSSVSSEYPPPVKNSKPVKTHLNEKSKPVIVVKKEGTKAKESCVEQNLTDSSAVTDISSVSNIFHSSSKNMDTSIKDKQTTTGIKDAIITASSKMENCVQPITPVSHPKKETSMPSVSSGPSEKSANKDNKAKKEEVVSAVSPEKLPEITVKNQTLSTSPKRGDSDEQVPIDNKQVTNKSVTSCVSNLSNLPSSKNLTKGMQLKKETSVSQDDRTNTVAKNDKKVSPLTRENDILLHTDVNDATTLHKQLHKLPSSVVPPHNSTSMVESVNKPESEIVSPEISLPKNNTSMSPVTPPAENSKLSVPKRSRNRSKKKSANSQKVNTPAKLNEESKNSNDSLNVVFQSQPKNVGSENLSNNIKNLENNNNKISIPTDFVTDVPPVDKIAEEMEKLILEQLEEEERAKELSSGKISVESSPEHLLTAPPRLAEPPKEKPPPPPLNEGSPKESSLKRVNSTKRIKKEIHKRRSNFLGIENADESITCNEPSVPPPPALEEILKAEMELDRQTRLRIENEATERLTLEEKEIMQKEREIIETLESEERRKMYLNGIEDCNDVLASSTSTDAICEKDRIETLKCERKRIDTERQLSEEQQQILLEEKQLKEREEFIRQQEATISTVPLSDCLLSVSANTANNFKKPPLSSVPTEVLSNGLLLGANGDGNSLTLSSSTEISVNESSKSDQKIKASEKPAVPPKPLKKKEAIRKERERLRQEQEALQREREEHRRKLMLEQEELMKHQKSHGTLGQKFLKVAVVLTVIPLSLYYLFSCVSNMHAEL